MLRAILLVLAMVAVTGIAAAQQCPNCPTQGYGQPIYSSGYYGQPVYTPGYSHQSPSYSVPIYGRSYGQVYLPSGSGTCSGATCNGNGVRSYGPVRQFIYRR